MLTKLFVYGSLMKDMYNHHYLEGVSEYIGKGYVKGKLYKIKDKKYPAIILDENEYTLGEIYDIKVDFTKIDELESYNPNDLYNNEYNREIIEVYDENYNIIDKAYIYIYNIQNEARKNKLGLKIIGNDFKNG